MGPWVTVGGQSDSVGLSEWWVVGNRFAETGGQDRPVDPKSPPPVLAFELKKRLKNSEKATTPPY